MLRVLSSEANVAMLPTGHFKDTQHFGKGYYCP